jgi:thymidylate synthase (FAD)
MQVKLLYHTPNPEEAVLFAARVCYSQKEAERIMEGASSPLLLTLFQRGHLSPFEHASFMFLVEGVSRVTTHQLVRHRIASYSQQSQRFVEELRYIIPPTISSKPKASSIFLQAIESVQKAYKSLLEEGVPKEDARYILPSATRTRIVITMNARELLHFFRLRCCNRSQWEIKDLAYKMLECVKEVAPNLFHFAGPPCKTEGCKEGPLSCKRDAG